MANELVIKSLVDRNRPMIEKRLPSYLTPEQFFLMAYQLDRDPRLVRIAQKNPDSILAQIAKAADCGLAIGNAFGHCYVIGYGDEANFQVGWHGFVYLWERAGAIITLDAQPVYEGDFIEVVGGDTPGITHRPNIDDPNRYDMKWMTNPKNIKGAYAVAWLPVSPLKHQIYVTRGLIELARSCSPNKDGVPWTKFYHQMARKTAVRRLDGLIQVCGPTDQNREAWDRYARTIELDHSQFRLEPVEDEEPDDLPGVKAGRLSPKSGAAVEYRPEPDKTSPPHNGSPKGSEASPPPPKPTEPPPPPPAEPDEPISDEQQDQLIAQAGMSGMPPSRLKKFVSETYQVGDISELKRTQAQQLSLELKKRAANK